CVSSAPVRNERTISLLIYFNARKEQFFDDFNDTST
ncbi:unnamed protein product, partial [Rotaria magnacalcarata]